MTASRRHGLTISKTLICMRVCMQYSILYKTLCDHRVSNLNEATDVCTLYVVDLAILASTVLSTCSVDVNHNLVELSVNFLACPWETH